MVKRIVAFILALLTVATTVIGIAYSLPNSEQNEIHYEEPIGPPAPTPPPFISFDANITFSSEYINKDGFMPYALFTPSSASEDRKSALIVMLHGAGESNISEKKFMKTKYIIGDIANWDSEGFNAYVMFPQLISNISGNTWSSKRCEACLRDLIADFVSTHNIDESKIFVMGGSLGGQGTIYHSIHMADIFNKAVIMSGYPINSVKDYNDIAIPTLGFVGSKGEDSSSLWFMRKYIKPAIGEENYTELPAGHLNIPSAVFDIDEDENGRSDVIEWLFKENTIPRLPSPLCK